MPSEDEHLTSTEVLMNCLVNAERIEHIMVLVYTKDGFHEAWSNALPTHIRLGMLETAKIRASKGIEAVQEES